MRRALLIAAALAVALPGLADAQPRRPRREPRVEIGGGGGLAGGLDLGARDANLRSNSVANTPFRLFSTGTALNPAAAVEVRLGYRLTRRLTVEGSLGVARPTLTSSLSADVENAPPVEASETLTEYVIEGGGLWQLSTNTRRRWTPFVSGGGGVTRHVHEGRTLIESGVDGYAGGGLLYRWRPRAGLRLDGRVRFLSGGIADGQGVLPRGALTGSVFVTF